MTNARSLAAHITNIGDTPSRAHLDTTQSRRIYNPVQKDAVTFLKTSEETGGACTVLDMEVAPGGGNKLHYHTTFAEHFTVVSGEFGVQIGKEHFTLKPGESTVVPVMARHRWYNTGQQTALVRVELRPGNLGFERSLQIAYGLARDGFMNKQGLPKSIVHLALLVELADTGVPGFFSFIAPLMRMIAKRARRNGVERALIERYCR
jgi:mannose-6-phosphate isomerase-like protein (cupin superfamily)